MNIQKIKATELKPAKYNPRKDLKPSDPEYQKIADSIDYFGYVSPIIINKDKTVIGGHQRLKVLIDKGYEEVECVVVDLNKNDEKALNIALNKISGEWDETKLKELLTELNSVDLTEITGFDLNELQDYLFGDEETNVVEDNFNIDSSLPDEPKIKLGDLIILGEHRVYCGDSTKEESYKKLMNKRIADLIVTDPPYNVDYEGKSNKLKIQNDNMESSEFYKFIKSAYDQMFKVIKEGGGIYVFHADTEGVNFKQGLTNAGFKFAQSLVWVKNAITLGRQDYQWRHESVIYGWKEGAAHYFIPRRDQDTVYDEGMPDIKGMKVKELREKLTELIDYIYQNNTVLYNDKPTINDLHPTMKPLRLIGKLIHNSSRRKELVLDPFLGSGSTLIASEQLGRICYGMELDERYCEAIITRYKELKGEETEVIIERNGKKIDFNEL